jgi:predicted nucleic acid-binding protein
LTLLDAYALVALVGDEPAAEEVEAILRGGDARVVIVNLAEAIDVSQRVHRLAAGEVRAALEPLLLARVLSAIVSGESHAWRAAELRAKHFDKKARALSMADCFLLAHGLEDGEPIATSDPPLAAVARAVGIEVIALPDSAGKRPGS